MVAWHHDAKSCQIRMVGKPAAPYFVELSKGLRHLKRGAGSPVELILHCSTGAEEFGRYESNGTQEASL